MKDFKNADEILEFAVNAEQKAFNLYTKLANQSRNNEMLQVFESYAQDAMKHKMRIQELRRDRLAMFDDSQASKLDPSEFSVPNEFAHDLGYLDALILAIQREKALYKLYTNIASVTSSEDVQKELKTIALSVADHNIRFELEHDAYVAGLN